jgi:glutamate---cysteine ligase / carboxylate-amine ligase
MQRKGLGMNTCYNSDERGRRDAEVRDDSIACYGRGTSLDRSMAAARSNCSMCSCPVPKEPWGLFERYGIEIEYIICDRDTLAVVPIADQLMHAIAGSYCNEVQAGSISYSNELAMHVFELKLTTPVSELEGIDRDFQDHVCRINTILKETNACLMTGGMHPWMDPYTEMRLWTHEQNDIYEAYHRIFNCSGHGWANLQSTHINLPFSGDEELKALHSAIRWVLPIMPALSASSPIADGRVTGFLDTRLETYRHNQCRIPTIAGLVVPEPIASGDEYIEKILTPMWKEIAPHDPDQILQEEWLNSRGAIVRFDRGAIEIRILDNQECPAMDIAIAQAIVSVLKRLSSQVLSGQLPYDAVSTESMAGLFLKVVKDGEQTLITDPEYLAIFNERAPITAQKLWERLLCPLWESCSLQTARRQQHLLRRGPLARALLKDWQQSLKGQRPRIYKELCKCLDEGRFYG